MKGERRRFTLLDAMVLVAATAVGIAAAVEFAESARRSFGGMPPRNLLARYWFDAVSPLLTAWALTLIVLALRPPRARFRRLLSRPGVVVCMASAGAAVLVAIRVTIMVCCMTVKGRGDQWIRMFWWNLIPAVASAVAMAWLLILLGGRWRRSADWIDAAGRALGLAWFALDLTTGLRWLF